MFLLDTNVWVQYLRGRNPVVRDLMLKQDRANITLCSIVLSELHYGACCSARPERHRRAINELVAPYLCFPFDEQAAEIFGQRRRELETKGTPIGPLDLQIASIALARGCVLVTHNVGEFERVVGLQVEDWE